MMRRLSPGVYQGGQGRVFQAQNRAQAQQMAGVRQRPQAAPRYPMEKPGLQAPQNPQPNFQPAPPGFGGQGAWGQQLPGLERQAFDRAFQQMGQQQGGLLGSQYGYQDRGMSPMQPSFQDPSGGGGYGGGFASQGQMNDYNSGLNREMQGFGSGQNNGVSNSQDPRRLAAIQQLQSQMQQYPQYGGAAAMNPMQKPGGL